MADIVNSIDDYQFWRDEKLANAITDIENCLIEINNPKQLTQAEKSQIIKLCSFNNFALFAVPNQQDYSSSIVKFNQQFGLNTFDNHLYAKDKGMAHITQSDKKDQAEFIPYTNKTIGWHTDGYYNSSENRIRAFCLFCINQAKSGGENQWLDHQMAYLLLREENPDVAKALTHPQAMSIPKHIVNGKVRRETSVGAIFFVDDKTQQLYMRYTQRKKYIEFHNSQEIKQAVAILDKFLASNTPYHFAHTMKANQGLLCNNILHKRSAFIDNKDKPRLMLRGRYFNNIN
jgi:alpha-ketoglutarate-dependent taurine dioxygenase